MRFPTLIAALLLAAAPLLSACSGDTANGNPGQRGQAPTASVEVIQARQGALPLREQLTGTVRAQNQVTIYPEISAPVTRVVARNGDFVREGAPLAYLRDQQYQDQLRQVNAALRIAEADAGRTDAALAEITARLDRVRQLAERNLESPQELETLEAQVAAAEAAHAQALARIEQAEANVQEQEEAVRRTIVRAPVSGYVGQRNAEVGMRVDPSQPLFTIGDFDQVRVDLSISDRMMGKVVTGNTALIRVEGRADTLVEASITRISPFLEQGTFSAAAEIDVPNPGGLLRPGMFVGVDVLYGESEQATVIPEAALYEDPNSGILGVFVAPSLRSETPVEEPDTYDSANPPPLTEPTPVNFQPLEVLARGGGLAGVVGIAPGDWVLSVGQHLIRSVDGTGMVQARPVTWARVAELQRLQDRDLLLRFMAKQQRIARESFGQTAGQTD